MLLAILQNRYRSDIGFAARTPVVTRYCQAPGCGKPIQRRALQGRAAYERAVACSNACLGKINAERHRKLVDSRGGIERKECPWCRMSFQRNPRESAPRFRNRIYCCNQHKIEAQRAGRISSPSSSSEPDRPRPRASSPPMPA